jgi:hypothetical protein
MVFPVVQFGPFNQSLKIKKHMKQIHCGQSMKRTQSNYKSYSKEGTNKKTRTKIGKIIASRSPKQAAMLPWSCNAALLLLPFILRQLSEMDPGYHSSVR